MSDAKEQALKFLNSKRKDPRDEYREAIDAKKERLEKGGVPAEKQSI